MKKSQTAMILKALKKGRKLTPLDALSEFGCFRLGARCFDLKQAGHNIVTTMVKSSTGKRFASYELVK